VEVEKAADKKPKTYAFSMKAGKDARLVYPLQLEPTVKVQYFEIEPPFNPLSYLKNPMVLMVGFSAVMMFMMKRMPKQDMEQMQEMQKEGMPQCAQQ